MAIIAAIIGSVTDSPETASPGESPAPLPTYTPVPTLTSLAVASNTEAPALSKSIAVVSRVLDESNLLDIEPSDLKTMPNPKGEGVFVYSSQTRYAGVERYVIWLVIDDRAFPLNGATKNVIPSLPFPRDAPSGLWDRTGLDMHMATEAIGIVFNRDVMPTSAPATSACPTSAEQDYFNELDGEMRGLGTLVTILGKDLERAEQNPLLLADEVWIMGRDQDIHIISLRAEGIPELESPESAAKVSRVAQQMSQRVQTAMAYLKIGIKDSDDAALNDFSRILEQSAGDVRHIRGLIDSWCGGR